MSSNTTLDVSGAVAGNIVGIGSLTDAAGATGHQVVLGNNTLDTGWDYTSTTFSGAITGNGGLMKDGGGVFTLFGASTYAGATTINSGTLQLGNGGTTGSIDSTSNVVDNAALVFNRSDNPVFAKVISGSGTLAQLGPGALILTAANTLTGRTTISAGHVAAWATAARPARSTPARPTSPLARRCRSTARTT